ncbi:hypothetical protein WJX73_004176 [Symbiochloris irregularis]|uniref:Uncharacterized protein n=1 Tax=Symbiochloris irregularis TaxID=706552 RepID=A0AAW1PN35_9CHLO
MDRLGPLHPVLQRQNRAQASREELRQALNRTSRARMRMRVGQFTPNDGVPSKLQIERLQFSPDCSKVACCPRQRHQCDGEVRVYDLDTFTLLYAECFSFPAQPHAPVADCVCCTLYHRWAKNGKSITIQCQRDKYHNDSRRIPVRVSCTRICTSTYAELSHVEFAAVQHDYCSLSAHGKYLVFRTADSDRAQIACSATAEVLMQVDGLSRLEKTFMWSPHDDDRFAALSEDLFNVVTYSVSSRMVLSTHGVPYAERVELCAWPANGPVVFLGDVGLRFMYYEAADGTMLGKPIPSQSGTRWHISSSFAVTVESDEFYSCSPDGQFVAVGLLERGLAVAKGGCGVSARLH